MNIVSPFWTKVPNNFDAITGQKVVLDCQAGGYPEPQIRWKKVHEGSSSKNKFKTIISNHYIHILENGSLFFNEIKKSDQGKYICVATNGVEPTLSKFIELQVNSKFIIIFSLTSY